MNLLIIALFSLHIHSATLEDPILNDLPPPTIENMRWNIPPNDWIHKDEYLVKGTVFKANFAIQEVKINKDGSHRNTYNLYPSNSGLTEPFLRVDFDKIYDSTGSLICKSMSTLKSKTAKKFIFCQDGGCEKRDSDIETEVEPKHALALKLKTPDSKECPYHLDFTYAQNAIEGGGVFFKFNKVMNDKNFIEVNVNYKPVYLDIRKCKTSPPGACGVIEIKRSKYEENWIKLKEIQRNKSHAVLNKAITNIVPCLKTKNKACVEKYISNKKNEGPDFIETKITDEIFEELEKCLTYKNLLPHLLASRGIKKACIFNSNSEGKPLRGVAYIESLYLNGKAMLEE